MNTVLDTELEQQMLRDLFGDDQDVPEEIEQEDELEIEELDPDWMDDL